MADDIRIKEANLISIKFIAIFVILSVGILAAGFFSYREFEKRYRNEVDRELTAISELKVAELVRWRSERIGDGKIISSNIPFSDLVRRYLGNQHDHEAERQLQEWIDQYSINFDYDQVRLIDTNGVTRMSSPAGRPPASEAVTSRIAEVVQSGRITIVDLYRHDYDRQIYLSILVPICHLSTGRQPIAVIALRIDPAKYLNPFILNWPLPSVSAETLLVRRDGKDALYLNELKFRKDSALTFRIPLERTDVPAVKVVLGQAGIVEGIDYRGEQVIASVKNVHDSPWFLEARMDRSEAYAPARRLLWMTIGLITVLIFSTGLSLAFVRRQQNIVFYRERYQAAEVLRESEERFRSLFERVHVIALVIDPTDGSIVEANPAASVFYGWTRSELQSKKITDINTLSHEAVRMEMEAAKTEQRFYFLFKHRRSDGSIRDVEVYSGPIQSGGKMLLYSIIHDITERRKAEEKIQQMANEQRVILETIPIGVVYVKERKLVWTNPAFLHIFGHSLQEAENLDARKLYAHWEDYERVGREGYAIINAGEVYSTEVLSARKDGSAFWLNLTGRAVNPYNSAVGSIWMLQDITAKRNAEEQLQSSERLFRESIEFMTIPIGIANADGTMRHYNKCFTETFGYTISDIPTIEDWLHAAYPDPVNRDRIRAVWDSDVRRAAADGASTPVREYEVCCRDGRVKHVEILMRPIDSIFIGTFYDITDRKHAEKVLQSKTLQLETLTKTLEQRVKDEVALRLKNEQLLVQQSKLAAMGEMLGAIAHQWRQPLNTLGLCVQNINDAFVHGDLNRTYLDRTVQKSMDQIHHMSKTIDDFRNFFKPDKEISSFDTMTAVGDVLSLFSAQLMASDIGFRLTCHTHGKVFDQVGDIAACPEKTVDGYRNEFEHVILNLISNARDAIAARRESAADSSFIKGLITFDFFNRDGNVIIEVGDNGTGIPESVISRIFEPYFTMKEQSKGTGIGLYMSKIIIEDHMKGSLTAKNGQEGAALTIVLRQAEKAVIS